MNYARVCVDIDASKDILKIFQIDLGYAKPMEIRVEVPWKPSKCKLCKVFLSFFR